MLGYPLPLTLGLVLALDVDPNNNPNYAAVLNPTLTSPQQLVGMNLVVFGYVQMGENFSVQKQHGNWCSF